MTFNQLIPDVVGRWQSLHGRLSSIDEQQNTPQIVRQGRRLETVIHWRDETLPIIDRWLKVDVAEERNQRKQDAATALTRIRAGKPIREPQRTGKPEFDFASVLDAGSPEPNRDVLLAIQSMRGELLHHSQVSNAIALHQLSTTERLAGIISGYRAAADTPDEFPVEAFRIDSAVLPVLLRSRADAGDVRASFALQQLEEVEPALLAAAGVPDVPERDGRLRDVEQIREAVAGLGRG